MKIFMEILVDSFRLDSSFKSDLLFSLPINKKEAFASFLSHVLIRFILQK